MASQVGDYHHKFEGGKVVSAVVMPPQAHREMQGKQNKTKQNYPRFKNLSFGCKSRELCADVAPDVGIKAKSRLLRFL